MLKQLGAAVLILAIGGCGKNGNGGFASQSAVHDLTRSGTSVLGNLMQSLSQPQQPRSQPSNSDYDRSPREDARLYSRPAPRPHDAPVMRSGRLGRQAEAEDDAEQPAARPVNMRAAEPASPPSLGPGCKKVPKTTTRSDGTQATTEETECPISFGR